MALLVELKRRKVLRAAFSYTFIAWLILQVADVITDILVLPDWIGQLTLLTLLAGFPVAMALAWFFDLTDLGIYREQPLDSKGLAHSNPAVDRVQTGSSEYLACVCIFALGTLLSVGSAVIIHVRESIFWQERVDRLAYEIAREFEHMLEKENDVLVALRALFVTGEAPSIETFTLVAERYLMTHSEILAIEWAPRIEQKSVEGYVAEMNGIYPGYNIKMFNALGEPEPIEQKATYFPVGYTVPRAGNETAIGFDLSSNAERYAALNIASGIGSSRQSKSITLVQTGTAGFLLFNPVYSGSLFPVSLDARLQNLSGFTVAAIDIREMLEKAIADAHGGSEFQGQISIWEFGEAGAKAVDMIDTSQGRELSEFVAQKETIGEFGERWLVSARPSKLYLDMQLSDFSYVVGMLGVLIAFLFALITDQLIISRRRSTFTHPQ